MKQKKVLIIGAGPAQYEGVAKARQMGLFTIATDRNPKAPGLAIADLPLTLDVKDYVNLIKVAREHRIDGVFTIASEVGVRPAAAIAEEMKLPGISREVARIATDKGLMRQKFAEHGVPSPSFRIVGTLDEAIKAVRELSPPLVIKPVDNAGARGVTRIDSVSAVPELFERARSCSGQGKVIIESYMAGETVSAEAFAYQGKIRILALSDKTRTPEPYFSDTTVIFPSGYPPELQDRIRDVATRAIQAVGITDGPAHVELMVTAEGPKMIELAARGPGFKVFTDMIPYVTGVDVVAGVIKLALGEEPDLEIKAHRAAVLRFTEANPGKIKAIKGLELAKGIAGVHDFDLYVGVGDEVRPRTCGDDRIGHIISYADTREQALEIVRKVERSLQIEVEAV